MTQTEKEMEVKRTTLNIEPNMKAEMEQKRIELKKTIWRSNYSPHSHY